MKKQTNVYLQVQIAEVPGSNIVPCHKTDLCLVVPNSTLPLFVNNQLVSFPPTEILNTFLFNSQYLLAYFIVPNYFSTAEHLDTEMTRLIFEFLFSLYQFTAAISADGW